MRLSKICLWGMAATIVATLVAPLVAMQTTWAAAPERLFGTGLIVLALFAVTLGAAAAIDNRRARGLMWSGVVAAAIAAALWITAHWTFTDNEFLAWQRVFTWPGVYACFVMITGVLLLVRAEEPWHRWLRRGTVAMLGLLALQIALATSLHPGYGPRGRYDYEESAMRLGLAIGLVAGGGVVGTLVGAWLCRVSGGAPRALEYWIRCPRCGGEQSAMTGEASCTRCGLTVKMEVV